METGINSVLETNSGGPSPTWMKTSKPLTESGRILVETYQVFRGPPKTKCADFSSAAAINTR